MDLKQDWIGYTNVITLQVFAYLYREYGEKTQELQNKALEDMDEDVDISRPSLKPFQLKQEKLKLFLKPTEQVLPDGIYLKKCLWVIEKFNYINNDVLKWRARPLN